MSKRSRSEADGLRDPERETETIKTRKHQFSTLNLRDRENSQIRSVITGEQKDYTISLFRNELKNDARPITAYLFSRPLGMIKFAG